MKNKTILILCIISFVLGSIVTVPAVYYLTRCEKGGEVIIADPGKLSEPTYTKPKAEAIICGPVINIEGAMREGRFFTTRAWNNCMENTRIFELTPLCPVTYRPYSIQIQPFILAGYNQELKRFNVLAGGTLAFIWNYQYGSVGLGLTYAQGLMIKEYYAGASVIAQIDFGKRRN